MCTATLLYPSNESADAGLRLVTNRDEQHDRAPALQPQARRYGDRRALLPVDPSSDGTWVGVNDAGLAMTLLNFNLPEPPDPAGKSSRGSVITSLLHHDAAADAARDAAGRFEAAAMLPFRLIVADARACFVVRSDGKKIDLLPVADDQQPLMLTSSGLGDHLVEGPRRALFESMAIQTPAGQDDFHRHRWEDRSPLSVAMHRREARTVSRTEVRVGAEEISMCYTPVAFGGREETPVRAVLPRYAEATA